MAAAPLASLNEETLSWEPLRMVTPLYMKQDGMATLELSTVDLLFDRFYLSVLLFYDVQAAASSHDIAQDEPARRLHGALQELLLHYPCAAGVLVSNETDGHLEVRYPTFVPAEQAQQVSSNTTPASFMYEYGVPFHVAHANITLSDLGDVSIPHPSLDLLCPREPPQNINGYIVALQVTTFKCGGFTLAHTCSHAYADGYAVAAFLQNLTSIARGAGVTNPPDMHLSRRVVLRAREPPSPKILHHRFMQTRKRSEKQEHSRGTLTRIVFPEDALEALRARATKPGQTCSRYQALAALLWRAHARVRQRVHGVPGSQEVLMRTPINLRTRGIPNLTKGYMGNAIFQCTVQATVQELCEGPLADVAEKITSALGSLEFPECVQSAVDYMEMQVRDGLVPFLTGLSMTTLVGLPFYDTDCGWGSPMYVGPPNKHPMGRCMIWAHPAARAWNVLFPFPSQEEFACFREGINAECTTL